MSDIGPDFSEDQCGSTIWPDVEKFWWHSPMKYADKVKTPTLFLHSLEDSRSGKPKHRIRRLNEITGWFEQHKG